MIQQIKTSIKSELLIATLHYHNTVHTQKTVLNFEYGKKLHFQNSRGEIVREEIRAEDRKRIWTVIHEQIQVKCEVSILAR